MSNGALWGAGAGVFAGALLPTFGAIAFAPSSNPMRSKGGAIIGFAISEVISVTVGALAGNAMDQKNNKSYRASATEHNPSQANMDIALDKLSELVPSATPLLKAAQRMFG